MKEWKSERVKEWKSERESRSLEIIFLEYSLLNRCLTWKKSFDAEKNECFLENQGEDEMHLYLQGADQYSKLPRIIPED